MSLQLQSRLLGRFLVAITGKAAFKSAAGVRYACKMVSVVVLLDVAGIRLAHPAKTWF